MLKQELDGLIERGFKIGPEHFPAEWAAVRQFELLQEAGNYKIYDLDATHLTRTLVDLTRNMRAGGYRVTVASIGSYTDDDVRDDLEILDQRLQDRLSKLIHMLYLEEQSRDASKRNSEALASGTWDFMEALPHVGLTLGARDLFKPIKTENLSASERKHQHARQFFDILGLLSQDHIVHDTAIGLQLPESINENEWIYLAQPEDTLRAFNGLMTDLFSPFDGVSLSGLHERPDATSEIKSTVQHMRGYGDRLTPDADRFYRDLAQFSLQ